MPLPTKFKTIPFVAGLDGKTDDKAVQGKLLTCKNLVFSSPGVVKKRNLFKQYSFVPQNTSYEIQSTSMLAGDSINLYAACDSKHIIDSLLGLKWDRYSGCNLYKATGPTTNIDMVRVGKYLPVEVRKKNILSSVKINSTNVAVSASYSASVWLESNNETTIDYFVYLSVQDRTTKRYILNKYEIVSRSTDTMIGPRVFILGDDNVYVWYGSTSDTSIYYYKYTISTGSETGPSAPISDMHADGVFDVVQSEHTGANSFAIAYKESASGHVELHQINQSGSIVDTASVADVIDEAVCVFRSVFFAGTYTDTLTVIWANTSNEIRSIEVSEGTVPPAPTDRLLKSYPAGETINKITGHDSPYDYIYNISTTYYSVDSVNIRMFTYEIETAGGRKTVFWYEYRSIYANSLTAYEIREMASWGYATIISKPFLIGNSLYIVLGNENDTNGSYNICTLGSSEDNYIAVAQHTIASILTSRVTGNVSSLVYAPVLDDIVYFGMVENNDLNDATNLIEISVLTSDSTVATSKTFGYSVLSSGTPYVCSDVNGVELGFFKNPVINAVVSSGTGSMSNGTYYLYAVYEYIDEQGNAHYSGISNQATITLSAGTSTQALSVTVQNLVFGSTTKQRKAAISVYMTTNNGTTYYKAATSLQSGTYSVAIPITLSGTDLVLQELLYTASGQIFENTVPPPSNILLDNQDRLFFVNSMRPTELYYSKPIRPGYAPEFSWEFTINIPNGGDIVGLADMRGSVVVIKEDAVYVFSGEGPGADGRGTFGQPQLISNRGCISPESILQTDHGVYYQTENGIYLLAMDFSVQYVGGQVEDYNSNTVIGAVHMQDQNQARFLLDDVDNTILVHDYQMNQWATFTDSKFAWSTGQSANWDDRQIMCNSLATCYLEDSDYVTDEPFELTTEWIQMADWDGFQRIREIHVLGTYKNSHWLSMTSIRDYDDSKTESKNWFVDSDPGTYALRTKPKYQKCRAMKYKLTDGPDNTSVVDIGSMTEQSTVRTLNGTISISPYTNLYDLVGSAANARHYLSYPSSYATISGQYYCVSVVAKKGNKNWVVVRSSGCDGYAFFDLNSIAIGHTDGNEYDNSFVVDAGSGYVFCTVVVLSDGSNIQPSLWSAEVDNDFYYIGDAVTVNTSVSRFYVEQGIIPSALSDTVELNGLRIGYGVKRALAKSRSSST